MVFGPWAAVAGPVVVGLTLMSMMKGISRAVARDMGWKRHYDDDLY